MGADRGDPGSPDSCPHWALRRESQHPAHGALALLHLRGALSGWAGLSQQGFGAVTGTMVGFFSRWMAATISTSFPTPEPCGCWWEGAGSSTLPGPTWTPSFLHWPSYLKPRRRSRPFQCPFPISSCVGSGGQCCCPGASQEPLPGQLPSSSGGSALGMPRAACSLPLEAPSPPFCPQPLPWGAALRCCKSRRFGQEGAGADAHRALGPRRRGENLGHD